MSGVLQALRQSEPLHSTTEDASFEACPTPIKPRIAAAIRKTALARSSAALLPVREVSTELLVLFQVPSIAPLKPVTPAPAVASKTRLQPNEPSPPVVAASEAEAIPSPPDYSRTLDQITASLLEVLSVHSPSASAAALPEFSKQAATSLSPPVLLPRIAATDFELRLRATELNAAQSASFNHLAAKLRHDTRTVRLPMIALTSSTQQTDSAQAFARLAMRLAEELGRPVLLLDAAFSAAALTPAFQREESIGLCELLAGGHRLPACIFPTSIPNLDILPRGYGFASEYSLSSFDFAAQLQLLENRYAVILCDVGPLVHPWSVAIARAADAAYLAVELGRTPIEQANECIARLRSASGAFRGCVVLGGEEMLS